VRLQAKRNGQELLVCILPKAEFVATVYAAIRAFLASDVDLRDGCWNWSLGARLRNLFDGALDSADFVRLLAAHDRDTNVEIATRLIGLDGLSAHQISELKHAGRGEAVPRMAPDPRAEALFPSRFDSMPHPLQRDIVARALEAGADDWPAMRWLVSPLIERWLEDKGVDVAAALRRSAEASVEGVSIDPERWQPREHIFADSEDATVTADTDQAAVSDPEHAADNSGDDPEEGEEAGETVEGTCPICHDDCECEHLLVAIDRTDGPLYGRFAPACEALVEPARRWMFRYVIDGGDFIGDELGVALSQVAKARFSWRMAAAEADPDPATALYPETALPAFEELFNELGLQNRVWEWIGDTLADMPDVVVTHFEMSNAPGLSWHGRTFYARLDIEGVIQRATERLQARLQ
jgi:hypothetical protein